MMSPLYLLLRERHGDYFRTRSLFAGNSAVAGREGKKLYDDDE